VAFTRLNTAGAVVITSIEYDKVFEGIAATTRRNIYLTIAVLSISIIFILLFSNFFSDIRGFTALSENFTKVFGEDASDRIVHWLNQYFTSMVDCVEKTNGVVDAGMMP
jgi:hypothetical protein